MPERATGGDAVAHEPVELRDVRKAAALLARPDQLALDAHLEDAAGRIGSERHGAEFLCKRGQQFLRHPAGAQAPTAQSAISDLDRGSGGHGTSGIGTLAVKPTARLRPASRAATRSRTDAAPRSCCSTAAAR